MRARTASVIGETSASNRGAGGGADEAVGSGAATGCVLGVTAVGRGDERRASSVASHAVVATTTTTATRSALIPDERTPPAIILLRHQKRAISARF
jgi:hypothetical protein